MIPSSESVSGEYLEVNACGVQRFSGIEAGSTRPMGRVDYHIIYVTEGECHAQIEGKLRRVGRGHVILYRPGEAQIYKFPSHPASISYYLHFSGRACQKFVEKFAENGENIIYVGTDPALEEAYASLVDSFNLKLPYYRDVCEGMLSTLLALTARCRALVTSEETQSAKRRIVEACRRMHETCADNLPISSYAEAINLSESRFSHFFKEQMGVSPIRYLNSIKLDRAREYLEKTDAPILEISTMLGFQNQSYFCRFFKKHTSLSPIEYRKAVQ